MRRLLAWPLAIALTACMGEAPPESPDEERSLYAAGEWTCTGTTGHGANPDGTYYATSFGCWTDENGGVHGDGEDNCIPYCQTGAAAQGRGAAYDALCAGLTGRQCEERVSWYVADSDRFGCMTRLKVTNPDNGKAAIVVVLDKGPSCSIERRVDYWVLDSSSRVTQYLFGGQTAATERADVQVEIVADDTPLGPWTGPTPPPPPPPPPPPTSGGGDDSANCPSTASCTVDNDCVCDACDSDLWCSNPSNCDHDGTCDVYTEGCVCDDCAAHPACAGAPPPPMPSAIWRPAPGTTWQWQLTGTLDTSVNAAVYDVDLFTTTTAQIAGLHAAGRKVICYFSAGSYEPDRPDSAQFPAAVKGSVLDGWPDERWLDIRSSTVRAIMTARLELARTKGCDAVEPDNVDGYDNSNGLGLTAAHQLDYNRFLASAAHARGLSVGLKNALSLIPQLVGDFDWALDEECFTYSECGELQPFVAAGKAVFHAEYVAASRAAAVCAVTRPLGLSTILKSLDLGAPRTVCP